LKWREHIIEKMGHAFQLLSSLHLLFSYLLSSLLIFSLLSLDSLNSFVRYPVWVAPKLRGVEEDTRVRLLSLLRQLSEKKNDFHVDSPVKVILLSSPSLLLLFFSPLLFYSSPLLFFSSSPPSSPLFLTLHKHH
jgi:hypothetical protein